MSVTIDTNSKATPLLTNDGYCDQNCADKHFRVGGTDDVQFGFARCALPVVLNHNTPNNSVFILWGPGTFPHLPDYFHVSVDIVRPSGLSREPISGANVGTNLRPGVRSSVLATHPRTTRRDAFDGAVHIFEVRRVEAKPPCFVLSLQQHLRHFGTPAR